MPESFLNKVYDWSFIKKETPAHVFSYEFGENFKNTFFTEYLRAITSDNLVCIEERVFKWERDWYLV